MKSEGRDIDKMSENSGKRPIQFPKAQSVTSSNLLLCLTNSSRPEDIKSEDRKIGSRLGANRHAFFS